MKPIRKFVNVRMLLAIFIFIAVIFATVTLSLNSTFQDYKLIVIIAGVIMGFLLSIGCYKSLE